MAKKRIAQSKTINLNALVLALYLWTPARAFLHSNPEIVVIGVAALNIILRFFTQYEIEVPTLPWMKGKS